MGYSYIATITHRSCSTHFLFPEPHTVIYRSVILTSYCGESSWPGILDNFRTLYIFVFYHFTFPDFHTLFPVIFSACSLSIIHTILFFSCVTCRRCQQSVFSSPVDPKLDGYQLLIHASLNYNTRIPTQTQMN